MSLLKERDVAAFFGGFFTAFLAGILVLSLALGAVSCAASRPTAPAPMLELVAPTPGLVQHLDSAALRNWLPTNLTALPAYLVPPPAGSTPRQRRQWQRAQTRNLARAGAQPTKIKNSSVASAPGATAVNRPTAPVATQGSTATDARKAGTRGGSTAVGPGAVATSTQPAGVAWYWFVVAAIVGAVGWEIISRQVPVKWLSWRSL